MSGPEAPLLVVEGVTRRFGGVAALDGVSFAVPDGSLYGVIGPNGAGKSVLLNIITGLLAADSGEVIFRGKQLTGRSAPAIASVGIGRTFQDPRVFGSLTVLENVLLAGQPKSLLPNVLAFLAGERGSITTEARELAEALIEEVGLSRVIHLRADSLSFGQRKLLALANALRPDPALVLLDEPAAGVNPALINHIVDRIAFYHRERGKTFLIVEHNMRVMMELCDRILVLNQGRRLTEGSPRAVQSDRRVVEAYFGG